jgi:hypothetical protein
MNPAEAPEFVGEVSHVCYWNFELDTVLFVCILVHETRG